MPAYKFISKAYAKEEGFINETSSNSAPSILVRSESDPDPSQKALIAQLRKLEKKRAALFFNKRAWSEKIAIRAGDIIYNVNRQIERILSYDISESGKIVAIVKANDGHKYLVHFKKDKSGGLIGEAIYNNDHIHCCRISGNEIVITKGRRWIEIILVSRNKKGKWLE